MNLLAFVTNKVELVPKIMKEFMQQGLPGASVIDCGGMLREVSKTSMIEPPPIFGSMRRFLNSENEPGKLIFTVINDEEVEIAKNAIHKFSGGLDKPNHGVLFVMPVSYTEGVK